MRKKARIEVEIPKIGIKAMILACSTNFYSSFLFHIDTTINVATPVPGPTQLADPNRNPGDAQLKPVEQTKIVALIPIFGISTSMRAFLLVSPYPNTMTITY